MWLHRVLRSPGTFLQTKVNPNQMWQCWIWVWKPITNLFTSFLHWKVTIFSVMLNFQTFSMLGFVHVSKAGCPATDAASDSGPGRLPPAPMRNAQCSAVRGGPARTRSHPAKERGKLITSQIPHPPWIYSISNCNKDRYWVCGGYFHTELTQCLYNVVCDIGLDLISYLSLWATASFRWWLYSSVSSSLLHVAVCRTNIFLDHQYLRRMWSFSHTQVLKCAEEALWTEICCFYCGATAKDTIFFIWPPNMLEG